MGGNSFELSAKENTGIICGMKYQVSLPLIDVKSRL
jgi:hypothetical protein